MQLADARRVVLLNYNSETKHIDFRHYNVAVKPVGISKSIKRVITTGVPDLQGFEDISDYVLRGAFASESDVEDGPESTVTLGQDFVGRNNRRQDQRAIKLVELGPRMELRLVKIQAGMCDGEVLYHDIGTSLCSALNIDSPMSLLKQDCNANKIILFNLQLIVKRTPEELKAQKAERQKKMQEKAARRKTQEQNVIKKKAEKAAEKEAHRIATGGAPRKPEDDDEEEDDTKGKRKRAAHDEGDEEEEEEEEDVPEYNDSDDYSDMGDMAPQFSDDDEAEFSGEDDDQMEGFSDDEE